MLRSKAGIIDISNFAKYHCEGPGAEDWLNAVFANRMPKEIGRSCLTPLIGKRGGIAGDFTVTRTGKTTFWVIGSGMAERYHKRFFRSVPMPEGTAFHSITDKTCGFSIAGPQSRNLLQRLTNASLDDGEFPFMRSARIEIAGISCLALRVSFTGDLGWELHCDVSDQAQLYAALLDAGRDLGVGPVGSRALMSLRLEKGYGSWGREYSPEYWPHEVGLERLCKLDKSFLNKSALQEVLQVAPRERLTLFALNAKETDASWADATGGEPVFKDGEGIGRVTSGAYGYSVGQSLAMGFVTGAEAGDQVDVMVLGQAQRAGILDAPPVDPEGLRLRA